MLNQVVLIGRLTKDPELKKSKTGKSVSTVFVALNRNYTSADGIKADYPPVILWEKNAENTAKYCVKGSFGYGFDKNKLIAYINLSGSNIEVGTEYPISQFIDNQEAEFNYHKNYIEEILQMNIQYYNCFLENMKLGFEQIIIFEVIFQVFLTIVSLLIITFIYNFN